MKNRTRLILAALAAIFVAGIFAPDVRAQGRDSFNHSTKAHIKDCKSCHAMPTGNWVAARGYPDVAAFPGHYACFTCHRAEMFRPSAQYRAGCHTTWTNPRSAPRYAFPVRSRSNDFSTIFPHNAHQDIIASNPKKSDVAVAHFINAGFTPVQTPTPTPTPVPVSEFNNCAICHATPEKLPKTGTRPMPNFEALVPAVTDVFNPGEQIAAKFFKNSPVNHASCFTCHYQGVKPVAADCAGCHDRTRPYVDPNVARRYSLRFDHTSASHGKDCVTCHVRITQNADIRLMKDADVPIVTCGGSCHGGAPNDAPRTEKAFLTAAIANEIAAREDSIEKKLPIFQCSYCHTSEVGRRAIPPSHRLR